MNSNPPAPCRLLGQNQLSGTIPSSILGLENLEMHRYSHWSSKMGLLFTKLVKMFMDEEHKVIVVGLGEQAVSIACRRALFEALSDYHLE